jgi:hypothetical protein
MASPTEIRSHKPEGCSVAGVFINYRTGDGGYAAVLLAERLESVFGTDHVFLDSRGLRAGVDFHLTLSDRLRDSEILLAVIGPGWLTAVDGTGNRRLDDPQDYVRWEIRQAFADLLTVIPVLLDDVAMPAAALLPPDIRPLAKREGVRLRVRDSAPDLDRIVAEIRTRWSPIAARPRIRPRADGDYFGSGGVSFGDGATVSGNVAGRDQRNVWGRP